MEKKKQLFAPVWRHWKHAFYQYRWYVVGTLVSYGITTFLRDVYKVTIWRRIIDSFTEKNNPLVLFALIPIIGVVCWFIDRLGDWCLTKTESHIIKYLRDYALKRLVRFDTSFFLDNFAGSIGAKSRRFAIASESVFDEIAFTMIRVVITITGVFFVALSTVPVVGFILLGWAVLFGLTTWKLSDIRTPHDLASADAETHTTGHLSDIIGSAHMIHSYVREDLEYAHFAETTASEHSFRFRSWWHGNRQWAIQSGLSVLLEVVLMYYIITQALAGVVSVGTVVLVQFFVASVSGYMWMFGRSVFKLRSSFADAHEMAEIISEKEPEVRRTQHFDSTVSIVDHGILFQDVSFRYPKRELPVLTNVSFNLHSGKRYGFVGHTGSGKTTITRLLLRQFELENGQGKITIGGASISELSRDYIRSLISYVQQDPSFPFRTVREIIALGKPNAREEEIVSAAKKASCHDFIINRLEHGYDTKVGERGVKLSGGERQRLAIAAAFLKDAPILILDEPTSALDSETEEAIERVLKAMKDKTLIVIAHRLTTVSNLDEIIVLKNGTVEEQGSHSDLLEKDGAYASFWKKQFHI